MTSSHVARTLPAARLSGRRSRHRRLLGVACWACVYVLLAALALGANPLAGETVGPFDLLARYPAWNPDGSPVEVRHSERSDVLDALLPQWIEARRQLHSGVLPLWNPLPAGGSPALLDPSKGLLTLGFAVFAASPDPAIGFYFAILATLVVGALGMHLLVAQERSQLASVLAGSGFMLSGFVSAWLYWPQVQSAIWVPWLLLAVHRLVVRDPTGGYMAVAVATALLVLGGFPFVAALGIGAAGLYALVAAAARGMRVVAAQAVRVLAALVLGLGLAAIPLLTLADTLGAADLGGRPTGSPFDLAHARLLLRPWATESPRVESNMYVGIAVIVLAALASWPAGRSARGVTFWAGAGLAVVGAVLTFGLLPLEWGGRLPVLSGNPWNRSILLLDIGLLLMAACGMDRVRAALRPGAGTGVAAIILLVNAGDLASHFRVFNGPSPTNHFYAAEPELLERVADLPPFQYVAQDNREFMVSGTLGAIGAADWFAHSLRSPALKRLLAELAQDPLTTPTATAIPIDRYAWADRLADDVGLCHAAHAPGWIDRPVVLEAPGSQRVPLGPINGRPMRQQVQVEKPLRVTALSLLVATYRASDADGKLEMTLRSLDRGVVVQQVRTPAARALDNRHLMFPFAAEVLLPPGRYEIELRYEPGPRNRNITVWVLTDAGGEVVHGSEPRPGRAEYRFYGPAESSLLPVVLGTRSALSVNPGCAPGAYWTERPGAGYRPSASEVRLVDYVPHRFRLDVSAARAGYVVVPMQYLPGWRAHVDGVRASIQLAHGVLPAVPVPRGRSVVEFTYEPPSWRLGALLSTTSLLILLVVTWRRPSPRPAAAPTRGGDGQGA